MWVLAYHNDVSRFEFIRPGQVKSLYLQAARRHDAVGDRHTYSSRCLELIIQFKDLRVNTVQTQLNVSKILKYRKHEQKNCSLPTSKQFWLFVISVCLWILQKKIEKRQNFPPTLKPQIMFEKRKQEAGIKKQCSVVIIG